MSAPLTRACSPRLGGQVMPRGLWQAMAGMETEKQIIEQRIVLPLVEPEYRCALWSLDRPRR